MEIGRAAREKSRITSEEMDQIIIALCQGRYLTIPQIAAYLGRKLKTVQDVYLPRLLEAGRLVRRYPEQPTHPNQCYKSTAKMESECIFKRTDFN